MLPPKEKLRSNELATHKSEFRELGDYYPIPYTDSTRIRITRYLEKERTFPYTPLEAKDLSFEELNHLNYLLLSIEAFYEQKNKYHTPKIDLIYDIMSLEGAKKLKRKRLKSFLMSNDSKLIETPDWWHEIKETYIEDIGEIYNYNYCMFWNAPDDKDYLIAETPLNLNEEVVSEFKDLVEEIISKGEDFNYTTREEILLKVSSSKALNDGKSVPNFSAKSKKLYFSKRRKEGRRVLITTGPGSGRDAIINEIDDLNTIQFINENVRNYLEKNFRSFLLLGNAENSKKKYFKLCKKAAAFYARDIKKEGLSKPKYILKILLEALHRRYPDCEAFEYSSFFDGPWYEGDKGLRGHGLGMANELTTLMQIMVYFFTNRKLGEEGTYISSSRALFLNDDAIIFFSEVSEETDDFIDMDFYLCSCLGIIAQKDKSFFSKTCAVFCELYYSRKTPIANDKESYLLREQKILLRSGSILEAKFLLGNLKGSLKQVENMLKIVYTKFGYEFSSKEIDWPITFGGIRPMKLRGTDFSIKFIEEETDIRCVYNAYRANKHRRLWNFNRFLKNYESPILTLYPSLVNIDPQLLSKLGIGSTFDLACSFFRPTKEHKFHSSIKKLYKKRENVFKENIPITYNEFVKEFASSSLSNVYLPDEFIEREIEVILFEYKDFKDPYTIKNPITALLNLVGLIDDDSQPRTEWGLFNTDASLLNEKSVFARARAMNTLSLIDRFEEDFEYTLLVFPKDPNDIKDFMESYPKPFLCSELVRKGNKLPLPKKDFRNPVLEKRRDVYPKYLSYHQVILSQTHTWEETRNIVIFEMFHQFEYDKDFWDTVFENIKIRKEEEERRQFNKGLDSSTSSDSEDNTSGPLNLNFDNVNIINATEQEIEKGVSIEDTSESEEIDLRTISEQVDTEITKKFSENPFMILHGPLPEGDISVYGSEEWIKWFVQQHPMDLEEYLNGDEDLAFASIEMLAHKRKKLAVSSIFSVENEIDNLKLEAKNSYIAKYYLDWIYEPVEEGEDVIMGDDFDFNEM